jgi:hypothetical protein
MNVCLLYNHGYSVCQQVNGQDPEPVKLYKSTLDWQTIKELKVTKIDSLLPTDNVFLCNKHQLELDVKINPRNCCLCMERIVMCMDVNQRSGHNEKTINLMSTKISSRSR